MRAGFQYVQSGAVGSRWTPDLHRDGVPGISDGGGERHDDGAIFVWADYRSGTSFDIYAQKVSVAGNVLWTTSGVAVCATSASQVSPQVVSDGAGGAIITWMDNRNVPTEFDIYTQRINQSGTLLWGATGEPVCTAAGSESSVRMIPDGTEGAFIVWSDARNPQQPDIYAQRMSYAGFSYWTYNGKPVCTATFPAECARPHVRRAGRDHRDVVRSAQSGAG